MDRENRERELISIVSYLYYYADMNQSDIADRLFLSRSTVSRIIKKARQSGTVEIKINEPWDRDLEMEDLVKTTFPVDSVRVLRPESDKPEQYLRSLGKMVSYYLSCNLKHNSVLGLSWGNTVAHVVDSITNNENISFTVVPIMGSNNWIVRSLGARAGAEPDARMRLRDAVAVVTVHNRIVPDDEGHEHQPFL